MGFFFYFIFFYYYYFFSQFQEPLNTARGAVMHVWAALISLNEVLSSYQYWVVYTHVVKGNVYGSGKRVMCKYEKMIWESK